MIRLRLLVWFFSLTASSSLLAESAADKLQVDESIPFGPGKTVSRSSPQ